MGGMIVLHQKKDRQDDMTRDKIEEINLEKFNMNQTSAIFQALPTKCYLEKR